MIKDKTVVLTGAFSMMKRTDAAKALKDLGAKIGSSVTKNTDILFAGERAGSKLKKAESFGVTIMNEADLMAILSGKDIKEESKPEPSEQSEDVTKPHSKAAIPVSKEAVNAKLPYWTEIPYVEPKEDWDNEDLRGRFGIKPDGKIGNVFQTEHGHLVVFIYHTKYLTEEMCQTLELDIPEGNAHPALLWQLSGASKVQVLSGVKKVYPFDGGQVIMEQDSGQYYLDLNSGERSRAQRGCIGIPVCESMRVLAWASGIELYQQRGNHFVWLDSLDKGGRQYFYDNASQVVGLLDTDSKDKQWLYLVAIKGGKLHHNRTMKVPGDLLEDWRDTEIFQKDGSIMMRSKAYVENKQQWVLENLGVVPAKHSFEKDWKKDLKALAGSNKNNQGMGFVPIDQRKDIPLAKPLAQTSQNDKGEVFWKGKDRHTWVFVPDDGEKYPRITHGTYMLEYEHPDGRRVSVDLGFTDGIYDGFPYLCGNFLPRLGNNRGWNSQERTVRDIMSIQLQSLRECFYASVFDNGKKGLVYCELSEKGFEVDLETGSSRSIEMAFSSFAQDVRGRVLDMEIHSDRRYFIQFENAYCSGSLDDDNQFAFVPKCSLRIGKDILVNYGDDTVGFSLLWNHPSYEDMAWVAGVQQKVWYTIGWLSFPLPCTGMQLVREGNRLFAVNERHVFEFNGFTQALNYLRNEWPKADRDTPKIPEGGWGDLGTPIEIELDDIIEEESISEEEAEVKELSELRFMSLNIGEGGHAGLRSDIIEALHLCDVINRVDFSEIKESVLTEMEPCSLLLWVSDYDGIVIPMAIPDSEISSTQRKALDALNGNYMESWFMSDVAVEDWLSALTLLVLTDNIGDVLEDMAGELEAEGIHVNVDAFEALIGDWTQYGIDLQNPESLDRRFSSVTIVQLAM